MDTEKIDKLIRYIVLSAGQEDDIQNQTLGPIHIIKYVYLGDLAYAERNQGETFTRASWRFHHFGPWTTEVYQRIDPALAVPGVERTELQSQYGEDDVIRWRWRDDQKYAETETELPFVVARAVRKAIHHFGADTYPLLHEVYRTQPMLHAAPEEFLDFSMVPLVGSKIEENGEGTLDMQESKKQSLSKKARQKKINDLRERVNSKLHGSIHKANASSPDPVPRYDHVFSEGQKWLDRIAGGAVGESRGELTFSSEIWKHPGRTESDAG
jgi:hypothetical protein